MTSHPQSGQTRTCAYAYLAKTWPIGILGLTLSFPVMVRAEDAIRHTSGRTLDLRLLQEDFRPIRVLSQPDFSGSWQLDETRSDDPKQAFRAAAQRPERSGAGVRGRGPSGGEQSPWLENATGSGSGRGPRGGGRMGRASGERGGNLNPERLAGLFSPELEILQQASMVTISTSLARSRRVVIDDRGASVASVSGLGQGVTIGRWEGSTLVLETQTGNGRSIVQRFRLLAQPHRLELVTVLPTQRQDGKQIEVKEVFLPSHQQHQRQGAIPPAGG